MGQVKFRLPARFFTGSFQHLRKRPLTSFFVLLFILFILIAAGKLLKKPLAETTSVVKPKEVDVYNIGATPMLTLQARVNKNGVVKIVALTGGVVSRINVSPGQSVLGGATIISLSTNYQGGNVASLQKQMAARTYQNVADTFDAQKDLINKQRDLANKGLDNATQLLDITNQSFDESRSLISLNNDIISALEANINALSANNVNGANDAMILQTKQLKSQFTSANNQLNSALRNAEFQASSDKPPAQIANLQKDIAIKQLDIQEKSLNLNKEISLLQLRLAQVNEAAMFPAAPFSGVVDRVYVSIGQVVSPGTPLATISGSSQTLTAVAAVPGNIARNVSRLDSSFLVINATKIESSISYVSQEATEGQLYSIIFDIPSDFTSVISDKSFVEVEVPIGYSTTSTVDPYVPLDAIHQTQEAAFVFVITGDKAESREVSLGNVEGKFIEITSGLNNSDLVILDRSVVSGDKVIPKLK